MAGVALHGRKPTGSRHDHDAVLGRQRQRAGLHGASARHRGLRHVADQVHAGSSGDADARFLVLPGGRRAAGAGRGAGVAQRQRGATGRAATTGAAATAAGRVGVRDLLLLTHLRRGEAERPDLACDDGARIHGFSHVDEVGAGHRRARAWQRVRIADHSARAAVDAIDGHGNADARGIARRHRAGHVDLRLERGGIQVGVAAGHVRAGAKLSQGVALLLGIRHGAGHRQLAAVGARLREGEVEHRLVGLHVEAAAVAAVDVRAVFDDRMRGVVEQQHEHGAADATAPAGAALQVDRRASGRFKRPGVDVAGEEAEVEGACDVDQLHVVGGLNRYHLLAFQVVLVLVGRVGAERHVLVDQCAVLNGGYRVILVGQESHRASDADLVGFGGGAGPAVDGRLQAEGAVEVLVDGLEAFGLDRVDELGQRRRKQLVRRQRVRVLDERDHARGAQRVEFGAAFNRGVRDVVVHADDDRHAHRAGRRFRRRWSARRRFRGFDRAFGAQLGAVVDQSLDVDVAVGFDVGAAADVGQHGVRAIGEGQCAGHLQLRGASAGAVGGSAETAGQRAHDGLEDRIPVQARDVVVQAGGLRLDAGRGRH